MEIDFLFLQENLKVQRLRSIHINLAVLQELQQGVLQDLEQRLLQGVLQDLEQRLLQEQLEQGVQEVIQDV
jgi:hypothetical protein